MKKMISLLLVLVMVAAMAAGCGQKDNTNETTTTPVAVPASALEILENIWALYEESDKFPVMGGDAENYVDGAPGSYSLADPEAVSYSLSVPAEKVEDVDQAAYMVHGMLSNNFTSGVVHVKEGVDVYAFAEAVYDTVKGTQWMCGMPDQLFVAVIGGEYVLMAYGINDAIDPFRAKLQTAYPEADIKYDEAITG